MLRSTIAVTFLLCLAAAPAHAVDIEQTDAGGYAITARTYSAVIDAKGNFTSLVVDGSELWNAETPHAGGKFPHADGAESVNLSAQTVAARRGDVRLEYAFDETGIDVLHAGGVVEFRLSPQVTAAVTSDGKTQDLSGAGGGVTKVMAGQSGIAVSIPFHKHKDRFFPGWVIHDRGRVAKANTFRMECGVSASAGELIGEMGIRPVGQNRYRVPDFAPDAPAAYTVTVKNLGGKEVASQLHATLKDHWLDGKTLSERSYDLILPAGEEVPQAVELSEAAKPGFYWVYLEVRKDGKVLQRADRGFSIQREQYRPPLTRPDDFEEFWAGQLTAMRAVDFDAKLTKVPEKSTDVATHYTVEMTAASNVRIRTELQVPTKPGTYRSRLGGVGPKATDGDRIFLGIPLWDPPYAKATFTRWAARDDNNMLDCYLLAVRLCDYLRSRDDVKDIFLWGASRTGPIMFATACLDPRQIVAVDIHVPTSCGLSWTDKRYLGWGGPPRGMDYDEFAAMAAYFDPVNFAPDMTVPFIVTGGIADTLAAAPGIQAMANWADKAPWKRSDICAGGHQYFNEHKAFQKALAEYLNSTVAGDTDRKIMTEH